jgi:hypothetical protein
MSTCDDLSQQNLQLQEEKIALEDALDASERVRRAGDAFTSAEVGTQIILPGKDGPLQLNDADINAFHKDLAATMSTPEMDALIAHGLGNRARPIGAEGAFTNYDRLIQEVDTSQLESYARLTEALGITSERLAPQDYAFLTSVYSKERLAGEVARAYQDMGITSDVIAARMANDAAGFVGLQERMIRLRVLADSTKRGYLDLLEKTKDYMEALPGGEVPASLKQGILGMFRFALASERHFAFARRTWGQTGVTLRQALENGQPLRASFDPEEIAGTLSITGKDVGKDSHIGQAIQAIDAGPKGIKDLERLIEGARIGALDPSAKLDDGWFNTYMKTGMGWVKDSQLASLNTQIKANLGGNSGMAVFGVVNQAMENGVVLTPVGSRWSRKALLEGVSVASEANRFALDGVRTNFKRTIRDAFWEGRQQFGDNPDAYGPQLPANDAETAQAMELLKAPYAPGGALNPINWALHGVKLQVSTRLLFGKVGAMAGIELPWRPFLRGLGTTDEVFGKYQFLFKLKNSLEIRARKDGAAMGILDEKGRAAWVEDQLQQAIYQAQPTEANILAYRAANREALRDATDQQIAQLITDQNLAGAPTMATPESRAAMDYSQRMRLMNEPESPELQPLLNAVQEFRQSWVGESLIPYWRAPINQLLFDARLSTGGALDTAKMIYGLSTGQKPTEAMVAKVKAGWVVSGALLALFAGLDAGGQVKGGLEKDPLQRNSLFGIPFLGGIPILNTLFLWKDLTTAYDRAESSNFDGDEVLTGISQVLTQQLLRGTGLSTIQQLVEALTGNTAVWEKLVRTTGFIGAGRIPMIGIERNLERLTGTDFPSYFMPGPDAPGQRYWLDQSSPIAGVERKLRDLAYNTLPATAAITGVKRKTKDWLGSPIGQLWGISLAKGLPGFPWVPFTPMLWPKDPIYAELDTQDMLDPPTPLMTQKLNGISMSSDLQHEYNEIYGSVRGESLMGRLGISKESVKVGLPMPLESVTPKGVRIKAGSSADVDLGPFLEPHVKGKTIAEAFRSLFKSELYQKMEADPLTSADPTVADMPKALRRTRPAQKMIWGIRRYYDLLTQDELERRGQSGQSKAAAAYSKARTAMTRAQFERSLQLIQKLPATLGGAK